jgi:hypothetical protein
MSEQDSEEDSFFETTEALASTPITNDANDAPTTSAEATTLISTNMVMTTSTSSTSFHLPDALKLRGEENCDQWKENLINVARSNGISKYISERYKPPEFVDEFGDIVDDKALKLWNDHERGDTQMRMATTFNCKAVPGKIAMAKTSARDMWVALQEQYEGSGTVLNYNANLMSIPVCRKKVGS